MQEQSSHAHGGHRGAPSGLGKKNYTACDIHCTYHATYFASIVPIHGSLSVRTNSLPSLVRVNMQAGKKKRLSEKQKGKKTVLS